MAEKRVVVELYFDLRAHGAGGTMDQVDGTMAQFNDGTTQADDGTMAQVHGTTAQFNDGTTHVDGTTAQFNDGTTHVDGTTAQFNDGTTTQADDGTTAQFNDGTMTQADDGTQAECGGGGSVVSRDTADTSLTSASDSTLTPTSLTSDSTLTPQSDAERTPTPQSDTDSGDASRKPHAVPHLNIETLEEMREFLKDMMQNFVKCVVPTDTKLVDKLLADHLMTASDYSSLTGKHVHTKTQQARKLWLLFNRLTVEDFKTKVFPDLCSLFPNVPPATSRFYGPRSQRKGVTFADLPPTPVCLRHDLMFRVRPETMASILFRCGISLNLYSELVSDITKLSTCQLWSKLFGAFSNRDHAVTRKVRREVEGLLRQWKLPVPPDLLHQVERDVPCTCCLPLCDLPLDHPFLKVEEDTGETSSSGTNVTNESRACLHIHYLGKFQSPGSQYLGSDDPDCCLSALDSTFRGWAKDEGLTDETLLMLVRDGFCNLDELRRLTVDTVPEFLPGYSTLQGRQKLQLKEAIGRLTAATLTPTPAPHPPPPPPPSLSSLFAKGETARLLLVGKTAAGKSASGNKMLGQNKFSKGLGMGSHTKDYQFEESPDHKLQVMDCPGLFDTSLSQEAVCTVIVQALFAMTPGANAILYTLKIGDHYTDEEFQTFQNLKLIFGEEICRHMIILFTHGDALKQEGVQIKDYIQTAPDRFKQVLHQCGSRYVVFDNSPSGGEGGEEIQQLYGKVRELMDRPGASHFSPPHIPDLDDIEAEIRRRLSSHPQGGEFLAKMELMTEGPEDKGDGKKKSIWQIICDFFRDLFAKWKDFGKASGCG